MYFFQISTSLGDFRSFSSNVYEQSNVNIATRHRATLKLNTIQFCRKKLKPSIENLLKVLIFSQLQVAISGDKELNTLKGVHTNKECALKADVNAINVIRNRINIKKPGSWK